MEADPLSDLTAWVTEAGLAGKSETEILDGFCCLAVAAGLPIARALVIIDTLHPVHEGRVIRWRREGDERQAELSEYGPTGEGEAPRTGSAARSFVCSRRGARGYAGGCSPVNLPNSRPSSLCKTKG